jgi:hypothetical protein
MRWALQVRADNPELGFLDIGRKLGEMWRALDAESKKVMIYIYMYIYIYIYIKI